MLSFLVLNGSPCFLDEVKSLSPLGQRTTQTSQMLLGFLLVHISHLYTRDRIRLGLHARGAQSLASPLHGRAARRHGLPS